MTAADDVTEPHVREPYCPPPVICGHGPYETEAEARTAAASLTGGGQSLEAHHRLLEQACQAAGVQLGAYDHRIILWLANYEPAVCAVIAGVIHRAYLYGLSDPAGDHGPEAHA